MKPVEFEQHNTLWRGWPADEEKGIEEVGDLHAFRIGNESWSCWALSEEEMDEVMSTGVVWLNVHGAHPPVFVGGISPFTPAAGGNHEQEERQGSEREPEPEGRDTGSEAATGSGEPVD